MKRPVCPLCGGDGEMIGAQRCALLDGGIESLTWMGCDACGMVWNLDTFGSAGIRTYSPPDPASDIWNATTRADLLAPGCVTHLDIGCGTGALIEAMRSRGVDSVGFDPDTGGSLDHFGQGFDLVTAMHVLEHVEDPVGFIAEAAKKAGADGAVHIEVPDIDGYVHSVEPMRDVCTGHVNHFNRATLGGAVRAAGLSVSDHGCRMMRSGTIVIPSIWVAASKGDASGPAPRSDLDERRFAWYREHERLIDWVEVNVPDGPFWLFGAGYLAEKIVAICGDRARIVDTFLHGHRLGGHMIFTPDAIASDRFPVVISALSHRDVVASKIAELRS